MFIENPELRDRKSETDESFLFFFLPATSLVRQKQGNQIHLSGNFVLSSVVCVCHIFCDYSSPSSHEYQTISNLSPVIETST